MHKHNPYKKEYKTTYNTNTITINMNSKKNKSSHKSSHKSIRKSYLSYTRFRCDYCNINYSNKVSLDKHSYIHINPIYCYFPNCEKVFSPKHTYQYRQHMDSHAGGLNIKCKFCNHSSKSLSSNTLHMRLHHRMEYSSYMKNINKYNDDIKPLDSIHITKMAHLSTNYLNIDNDKEQQVLEHIWDYEDSQSSEDDPELSFIENNKYYDNTLNNLDLFADIALSYC